MTSGEGKFVIPTLLPGTYTIKAELQGFRDDDPHRPGAAGRPGNLGELDAQPGRREGDRHRHRRESGGRDDVQQDRHEHHRLGNRQLAERQSESVQPDADDPGARADASGRVVRRRPVQRQRAGDEQQPVPRRRAVRQRFAPRRLAGHAGARVARLDVRIPGADAPVRRRVRRLDRRRREQRDQERHQQARRPRLRVLPGQQAAGDRLLPETEEARRIPIRAAMCSAAAIGGPIVRNKLFFFFNSEQTRTNEAANLNFPANAAPLATSYSTTTDFTRTEHVPAVRLSPERQQPAQFPLDARSAS